jgi:hypothetical protein
VASLDNHIQDTYSKLVELCLFAGRSYDQGSWIRRGQATFGVNGTGRESPIPRGKCMCTSIIVKVSNGMLVRSELKVDEKLNSSSTSLPTSVADTSKPSTSTELTDHVSSPIHIRRLATNTA